MLPPGSFPAAAAAAEASLRLCGLLLQLSPQLVALAGEQGSLLGNALENVCCATNTTAITLVTAAAIEMRATHCSVDAHTAAAFGRLCATAAKLGLLLAAQPQLPAWLTDDWGLSLLLCAGQLTLASLHRLAPAAASLPGCPSVARQAAAGFLLFPGRQQRLCCMCLLRGSQQGLPCTANHRARPVPAGAAGSHVCVMGEPSPWCIPVHAAAPFARPVRQA